MFFNYAINFPLRYLSRVELYGVCVDKYTDNILMFSRMLEYLVNHNETAVGEMMRLVLG